VVSDGEGSDVDRAHMARALLLAERGRGRTSPNPMVGAVIVDGEGVVVGRGSHEVAGGPHAEIHALRDAGERARGATLYCTLEPCSHTGRTGPCAPRVVEAGIRRAVIAVEDPNPRVAGRGLDILRQHGVEVTLGVRRDEAERLNCAFFTTMRLGRPFVTMKVALSADCAVTARRGTRTTLTGKQATIAAQRERAEIDAIAIGSETLLVDDPILTARIAYRYRPLIRVIFDRRLRASPSARIFTTLDDGPVILFSVEADADDHRARASTLRDAGAQVELLPQTLSSDAFLSEALSRLAARGVLSMVVEGGPMLHEAFASAGLVDRVEMFVAKVTIGPEGHPWHVFDQCALHDASARLLGDDTLIEGYTRPTCSSV
jgi:diaminohydroxyphosphoribosylaminopyrimidine deaminase / 5-amino-6-(5-phosphoribosylamino)uracil reductase